MWLEKLRELREKTGITIKQIAEKKHLSEKTVARIFSGDTDRPYMDTLCDIVSVLDGSLDDIFSETDARLASADLSALQSEVDKLCSELNLLTAENAMLRDKVNSLNTELDITRLKLEHKEEIISLHNYYHTAIKSMNKL